MHEPRFIVGLEAIVLPLDRQDNFTSLIASAHFCSGMKAAGADLEHVRNAFSDLSDISGYTA